MASKRDSDPSARRNNGRIFVDLTPLKHSPAFARLWVGNSIAHIGAQMTVVAVGMHVYDITRSTVAVSLVAVWALGPMTIAGIWGGMIADVFDRRTVSITTALVAWASIAALALVAFLDVTQTWIFYALAAINAASSTILGATRSAIIPRLLPASLIPAATALYGIMFGTAITVGPALAGILVSTIGFGPTYLVDVILFTAGFVGVFTLPAIAPEPGAARPGLASLHEGWQFLRRAPNIRATFNLDLIAMTFGQPRVTFPALGMLVLGGGYVTAGVLTASVAVGALISGVASGWFGRVRSQGLAIVYAIAGYGLSILLFGIVIVVGMVSGGGTEQEPRFMLIGFAALTLALSGATDNVSAVFRSTILQVAAPDVMRGRLQGVFTVVVTGGPRIGDMYAGFMVAILALWAPAVVGGLAILALLAVFARTRRMFLRYDATSPSP